MYSLVRATAFACVAFVVVSHLNSQEFPSSPEELKVLLEKSASLRKEEIDLPISEQRESLSSKYMAALENAFSEVSQAGDLDAALEIKDEIGRIEEGEVLTKEYSSPKLKSLVSIYIDQSSKVDRKEFELRQSFGKKLSDALVGLQSDLTRNARVEDAVLVKEFREGDGFLDAVSGGQSANRKVRDALAIAFGSEAGAGFDTSGHFDGGAGGEATRVVFVPLKEGSTAPSTFSNVQTADMTDIVGVGRTLFPNLGMFRRDGSLVYWKEGQEHPDVVPGSVIYCDQSYDSPLAGLNSDGTVSFTDDGSPEFTDALSSATDVVHLRATSGVISLIKKDGSIQVIGTRKAVPTPAFMAGMSDVKEVEFAGAAFASVLKSDGSVISISNGSASEAAGKGEVEKLHANGIGENRSGKLFSWGAISADLLDEAGRRPKSVFSVSRRFAALRSDGSFFLSVADDQGKWEEQSEFAHALEGALSFTWLIGPNEDWIMAVVPAKSVSRSGVWSINELSRERSRR